MADINPMLHMDENFMWRWYQVDDRGQTSFGSPKAFFSWEDCRRDYDEAMLRFRRNMT